MVLAGPELPAAATSHRGAEPFAEQFGAWMQRNAIQSGAITVTLDGRPALTRGFGGRDPHARLPIWSLSKFITGVCVAQLVGDGRLRLDRQIGEIASAVFDTHRLPRREALGRVTIEQMLLHRSGIPTRFEDTTRSDVVALVAKRPPGQIAFADTLPAILAVPVQAGPPTFAYSNPNYALLGVAIEAAVQQPYEIHCGRSVLSHAGVPSPALSPTWRSLGPSGGWALSGAEYLAFVHAAVHGGLLPPVMARWMRDPAGKQLGGGPAFYSLGVHARPALRDHNFWHAGAWRIDMRAAGRAAVTENSGAMFVATADKIAWFASYAPIPSDGAMRELEDGLWRAHAALGR